MSPNNKDFPSQFESLSQRLSDLENSTSKMPLSEKNRLRQRLISTYEQPTALNKQGQWQLWRFAASATAVILLAVLVINIWLALSSQNEIATNQEQSEPAEQVENAGPLVEQETETAVPTATSPTINVVMPDTATATWFIEPPIDMGDQFRLVEVTLLSENIKAGQPIQIKLIWEVISQPDSDYVAFVHLLDEAGNLIAQSDQLLSGIGTFDEGMRIPYTFSLSLPNELTANVLRLETGLYNSATGEQLTTEENDGRYLIGRVFFSDDTTHLTPPPPPTGFPSPEITSLPQLPIDIGGQFRLIELTLLPENIQVGQPLQILLVWEATAHPDADYTAFVHLIGENGDLVAQANQSLGLSSTFVNGTRAGTAFTLTIPDELSATTLRLETGLYNPDSGDQLASADGTNSFYLGNIVVETETAVVHRGIVSGTANNGLTLRASPIGQPLAILEEGSLLILNEEPLREANSLIWQSVETTDGLSGWVATDFLIYPDGYDLPVILANQPQDRIWVIHAVQAPRNSIDNPIEINLTLGVQLQTSETATLDFHYAHPDWESLRSGRLPIDGLADEMVIDQETEQVEITAVLNPQEMAAIAQTNQPVLVLQLRTVTTDDNGEAFAQIFFQETLTDIVFDLESTEPLEYGNSPYFQFESALQKEQVTAVVTFEITAQFTAPEFSILQLFLVNPDSPIDLATIEQAPQLQGSTDSTYFITATPEQLREATGTETPIVVAFVQPSTSLTNEKIITFFRECPLDLTRSDEVSCKSTSP